MWLEGWLLKVFGDGGGNQKRMCQDVSFCLLYCGPSLIRSQNLRRDSEGELETLCQTENCKNVSIHVLKNS